MCRHFADNIFKLIQIAPNCIQTASKFENEFGKAFFQIDTPLSFGHDVLTLSDRDSVAVILLTFSN